MRAGMVRAPLAGWALVLGLVCSGCARTTEAGMPPSASSPLLERPLPNIRRPTLAGERLDTNQQRGSVVVVKFFAKYCGPCQQTLPAAQALHAERADVLVIGVSEDEDEASAREQVARYGLTFPVVLDRGNVIAGRFRVRELPAAVVADRSGRIVWVGGPSQSEHDLRRAVDALPP